MSDLGRRSFLGLAGLSVGAAMVGGAGAAHGAEPIEPRGDTARRAVNRLRRRPNFLIVMVDEMRYAPVYESTQLQQWRHRELKNINSLRRTGIDLQNHYVMSTACSPSRASIYTGQYPSLHGVTQTAGAAKASVEEDLYWLSQTTVPTMGDYFRAAGYDTYWKGKAHWVETDLFLPGSHTPMLSYSDTGKPIKHLEDIYLDAGILENVGFTGFIGPEPHGASPLNSGSSGPNGRGRDEVYARWGAQEIRRLRNHDKPWLLVTSFVNPHDITLWGNLTLASQNYYLAQQLQGTTLPAHMFDSRFEASASETLTDKPTAQASYRDTYPLAFQPLENKLAYHQFYYQLHQNVDQHIGRVLRELRRSSSQVQRDTIVIFISDHGELLGSHGGLFQKWFTAYEEMTKVPMIFSNPALFPNPVETDVLTSHADLLPTMLGLAGLRERDLRRRLRRTHTDVRPLVGRDLTPLLLGRRTPKRYHFSAQFFMTDDQVATGPNNIAPNGTMYAPVAQPSHLETVIAMLPTGPAGAPERWKYTRYFDNPDFWSSPGKQDVQTIIHGIVAKAGNKTATTTVKTTPEPDQIEVYNVSTDPTEMNNLASNSAYASTVGELKNLLDAERKKKRLSPRPTPRYDGVPPSGGIGV